MKVNVILTYCTLYCFQYSLQLMLELMLILFTINTWITKQWHYKGIDVYYIGYITVKKVDDCEYIYSVIPLCLLIDHASG